MIKEKSIFPGQKTKAILRVILAVGIIVPGILHFLLPEPFVKIVPEILPFPLALVYVTGIWEILAGIGLLIPSVSRSAAWSLVILLVAVYPANINMAINNISLGGVSDSPWFHAIRLPLQFVLIAWAYWYTKKS
ncbi:MAG: DoxX family protein [Spirulinaceae cyanobacterium]